MMEHELLKLALAAREEGRDHAVITIASTSGSAPRKNGKLLVFASGETHGTVGGGAVEQEAITAGFMVPTQANALVSSPACDAARLASWKKLSW